MSDDTTNAQKSQSPVVSRRALLRAVVGATAIDLAGKIGLAVGANSAYNNYSEAEAIRRHPLDQRAQQVASRMDDQVLGRAGGIIRRTHLLANRDNGPSVHQSPFARAAYAATMDSFKVRSRRARMFGLSSPDVDRLIVKVDDAKTPEAVAGIAQRYFEIKCGVTAKFDPAYLRPDGLDAEENLAIVKRDVVEVISGSSVATTELIAISGVQRMSFRGNAQFACRSFLGNRRVLACASVNGHLGGDFKREIIFQKGEASASTFLHELGHHLDNALGLSKFLESTRPSGFEYSSRLHEAQLAGQVGVWRQADLLRELPRAYSGTTPLEHSADLVMYLLHGADVNAFTSPWLDELDGVNEDSHTGVMREGSRYGELVEPSVRIDDMTALAAKFQAVIEDRCGADWLGYLGNTLTPLSLTHREARVDQTTKMIEHVRTAAQLSGPGVSR